MFPRSVYKFFFLLLVLSAPFWIFAAVAPGLSRYLPMHLPVSALMFVCPLVAALLVTRQEAGTAGVRALLARTFDLERVKRPRWYMPLFLFMPLVLVVAYGIMRLLGKELPPAHISFVSIPLLFVIYFVAAACEELAWMGFVARRATRRRSLLAVAVAIGVVWAAWHVIPFFQTGHSATWVLWQCVATVLYRVIIFWFYTTMNKSVFVAIIFHDMVNVSETLFPNNGSHFDPRITSILLIAVVLAALSTQKVRSVMLKRT